MSLTQIKQAAGDLTEQEQRELIAYLVAMQTEKDASFRSKLAAKIDDRDPANWMELKDLEKRYGG
jgi:hypothetical protein